MLPPGTIVALAGTTSARCGVMRRAGLEFRDTILVVTRGQASLVSVFRAPMEGTVAEQAARSGTGALHVDACRISMSSEDARASARPGHSQRIAGATSAGTLGWNSDRMHAEQHPGGRWPPNTLFVHSKGCRPAGVRSVRGANPAGRGCTDKDRARGVFAEGDPTSWVGNGSRVSYARGGMETVPAWECSCIVREFDAEAVRFFPQLAESDVMHWLQQLGCMTGDTSEEA